MSMNKDDDIICKQFIKSEIYIENEDEKKLGVLGEEHHMCTALPGCDQL